MNADRTDWPRRLRKRAREIESNGETTTETYSISADAFNWFWGCLYGDPLEYGEAALTAHECALMLYLAAEVLESGDD